MGNLRGAQPIPEQQIENIHQLLFVQPDCSVLPLLKSGERVRIVRGVMAGIEGTLLRTNSALRLGVSIAVINQSVTVTVARGDIEAVPATA